MSSGKWPKDVGIVAMEVYVPVTYVDQTELEMYDGAAAGKYTIGLGQDKMAFCTDREDINSLCLTVTKNLLEKNNVSPGDIGRLEVGTETIIDKSKSVKSVLMQLFDENNDIEGIDTTNACYGGTSALFNALNWVESSAWDRRLALVVCADIAVYAKGPARPTGGAGAIAMLVGPNAPLIVERGVRASYMAHVYDFYKPNLNSEYPVVNGQLSISCYFSALDKCYNRYKDKTAKIDAVKTVSTVSDLDALLFHCPFSKLVQKSVARLGYNDHLSLPEGERTLTVPQVSYEESFLNKEIEKTFMDATRTAFATQTEPSLRLAKEVGNMYTPSLYGGLAWVLLTMPIEQLFGKRFGLFSYGSGLASSFYSIRVAEESAAKETLAALLRGLSGIKTRLASRIKVPPADFEATLMLREKANHTVPWIPESPVDHFFPGTYYLVAVDEKFRRTYERIPPVL